MAWIIFTIILVIVGVGAMFVALGSVGQARYMPAAVAGVSAIVWVVLTFFLSLHTVGQREVGIVYSFSGTIIGKKDPGVVFTAPWQHIRTENVGIQSEEFDLDLNNAAVSQDQQPIYARLFVNFQVLPSDVVGLYKRVGPNWKHILLDARVLAPYDVRIVDVFLKNIGFSPAYTQAVEQKQVQVQQALQAQAKVAQSEAEARQKVAQARGEATAIALKGRALRNNPEILRLEAIDKLNPNAQVVICTGRTCPAFLPTGLVGSK